MRRYILYQGSGHISKKSKAVTLVALIILGSLIGAYSLSTNTEERPQHFGKFGYLSPGGGGSPFTMTEDWTLEYEASGSRFNVYVATHDQFSGYGEGPFGYIAELSRLNSTGAEVKGDLPPGDYIIWMDNIGEANDTSYLNFTVTAKRPGVPTPWDLVAVVTVTAVASSLITYVVVTRKK